jgi:hypothetical protein
LISQKLDDEFKMFLKWRGFNIDSGLFTLKFCPPQNFASYRQAELDTSRISSFTSLEPLPYMSKRFMLQRFLGLTEDEIADNERMWREERDNDNETSVAGSDLRSVGISPAGMENDISMAQDVAQNMGPAGQEGATIGPGAGAAPGAGPGAAPGGLGGAPGV